LKRPTTDSQQALRDELAEMARTGSPETKLQRAHQAEERRRIFGVASVQRPPDRSLPLASAAECVDAERRFRNAKTRSLLLLALLASLGVVGPVCLPATPFVITGALVAATAIVVTLVLHNREHRAAYVALQMTKGISDRDANREYDNTYSGD
jgi:hypothetical protein